MANILAVAATAASSADFTIAGETTTLFLVSASSVIDPDASVYLEIKSAAGNYYTVGGLSGSLNPMLVLSSPGTFRVTRPASNVSCGVDRV